MLQPIIKTHLNFPGLLLSHVFIITGMGLINLVGSLLNINSSGIILLWIFIFSIIYFQAVILSIFKSFIMHREILIFIMFFSILFVWRLMQSYWSIDSRKTLNESVKTIILSAFVFSVYCSLMQMPSFTIRKISVIITILSLASLVAYLWQLFIYGGISSYGDRAFKQHILIFGGSNTAGATILLLGLWNWLLVFEKELKYKISGIGNMLITLFLLIGITSYASLAGYIASVVLLILFKLWKTKGNKILFFAIGFFGIALVWLLLSDFVFVLSVNDNHLRTLYARIDLWADAWQTIRNGAWLYGIGAAGHSESLLFTEQEALVIGGGLHNALLQSLLEGGIVEFGLHIGLYVWLITLGLKSRCNEGIILVAILGGFFVRNLAESNGLLFGLLNNFDVYFSWYVITILIVLISKKRAESIFV